jgi:hypothetical protein
MFGPLVLAGNLGREGLEHKPQEFADNGKDPRGPRVPEEPVLAPALAASAADAVAHLRPVAGKPLTFVTEGIGRPNDVTLVPLNRIVDESYTVYWRLCDEAGWKNSFAEAGPREAARKSREARIVDAVWAGSAKQEAAHGVSLESPLVSSRLNLFRDATRGSASWKLKTAAGEPMMLRIGFVGAATSAFDIFVDGEKIAEERPAGSPAARGDRDTTTIKSYAIPASATAGKPVVEIRFAGHRELGTAHIVFCELSRPITSPLPSN